MKRFFIFGAGQGGSALSRWIPIEKELLGFIDNKSGLQGSSIHGYPVVSCAQAIKARPDEIWIAILNKEAETSIQKQLRQEGFSGTIVKISDIRRHFDCRLAVLRLLSEEIREHRVSGEVAELGVHQGRFAAEISCLFPERKIYLYDTFSGFAESDVQVEQENGYSKAAVRNFSDTSAELVLANMPFPDQVVMKAGHFPETAMEPLPQFAFVSLDFDLYEPTYHGLRIFYPKLNRGGYLLIHDYNSRQFCGVRKATDQYCRENSLFTVPFPDLHGSAVLVKQSE